MGLRDILERVAREDTGRRQRPESTEPPSGQLVVIPLDPMKVKAQLTGLQNRLVDLEGQAGRIEIKAERVIEFAKRKLEANTAAQVRLKGEMRALRETLVPFCHECGLRVSVPD